MDKWNPMFDSMAQEQGVSFAKYFVTYDSIFATLKEFLLL